MESRFELHPGPRSQYYDFHDFYRRSRQVMMRWLMVVRGKLEFILKAKVVGKSIGSSIVETNQVYPNTIPWGLKRYNFPLHWIDRTRLRFAKARAIWEVDGLPEDDDLSEVGRTDGDRTEPGEENCYGNVSIWARRVNSTVLRRVCFDYGHPWTDDRFVHTVAVEKVRRLKLSPGDLWRDFVGC